MKKQISVTRAEYDKLVSEHAEYMKAQWPELKRKWSIDGVTVSGSEEQISKLQAVTA